MNTSFIGLKKTLILFFVIFIGVECVCLHATEIPEEFVKEAKKVLSQRPKTYEDLNRIFDPILLVQTKKQFREYFLILFSEKFPKAPHSDRTITKGFQCLYSKMAYARTFENEKQEDEQLTASDEFKSIAPLSSKGITFTDSLKHTVPGSWRPYEVHFLGKFKEIDPKDTIKTTNVANFFSLDFDEELRLFGEPETNVFPEKHMIMNGKPHILEGSDLAILKFKAMTLKKKAAQLVEITPQNLSQYPAYAFGYKCFSVFSDGTKTPYLEKTNEATALISKVSSISLPPVKFFPDRNLFYTTYPSMGGNDECFSLENLPLHPTETIDKIYGRIFTGMSGGPLFFKDKEKYILGGVISQTYCPQYIRILNTLKNHKSQKVKKEADQLLEKFNAQLLPTYDVYQSFSKEDLGRISALMQSNKN